MKRFAVFSLLAALLLSVSASAAGPAVSCPSALLMEKQTGTVLFAQDEHTPREPASVTKIMTLLLTMEAIDSGALSYDDIVTGSAHAAGMGGSQIWLKENERMTGIEPASPAWEAGALPLDDIRIFLGEVYFTP